MSIWTHPVPPELRPLVVSWLGYDYRSAPGALHHGLPSTTLTVVLPMGEPIHCGWGDHTTSLYSSLVAGLHTVPCLVRSHGHEQGLHVALNPMASRVLLGMPAREVAGHIVDAGDIGWPPSLLDRMRSAPWTRRFELLQGYLLQRWARAGVLPRPEVLRAWHVIRRSRGLIEVGRLASHVGFSRRHLTTLVREEVGFTPKQVSRIARFEHAQCLMAEGRSLAEVAQMAGFSDQSHFTRDWKALAGITPTAAQREFPQVQDAAQRPG